MSLLPVPNLWLAAVTSNHSEVSRPLRAILSDDLPARSSSYSTETSSSSDQSQLTSEPLVSRPHRCIFYILSHLVSKALCIQLRLVPVSSQHLYRGNYEIISNAIILCLCSSEAEGRKEARHFVPVISNISKQQVGMMLSVTIMHIWCLMICSVWKRWMMEMCGVFCTDYRFL